MTDPVSGWQPPDSFPSVAGLYERLSPVGILRHVWNGSNWETGRDWPGVFCPQGGLEWRAVPAPLAPLPDRVRRAPRRTGAEDRLADLRFFPPDAVSAAFWSRPLP